VKQQVKPQNPYPTGSNFGQKDRPMRLTHLQELLAVVMVMTGVGWVALAVAVKRRAPNDAERSRRSQLFSAYTQLVSASLLFTVAVFTRDNFRYFMILFATFLAVNGLLVLRKNKKASVPPS
jgi:FtsH-binding integral membrane protein